MWQQTDSNMHSDEHRRNVLSDCICAMYWRYRTKQPDADDLAVEVNFAMQDFRSVLTPDLQEMFALAYRVHDGSRMPINKQVLGYWQDHRKGLALTPKVSPCQLCRGNGMLYAIEVCGNIEYQRGVRCTCANGARLSARIASAHGRDDVFTPDKILVRDLEKLQERKPKDTPIVEEREPGMEG